MTQPSTSGTELQLSTVTSGQVTAQRLDSTTLPSSRVTVSQPTSSLSSDPQTRRLQAWEMIERIATGRETWVFPSSDPERVALANQVIADIFARSGDPIQFPEGGSLMTDRLLELEYRTGLTSRGSQKYTTALSPELAQQLLRLNGSLPAPDAEITLAPLPERRRRTAVAPSPVQLPVEPPATQPQPPASPAPQSTAYPAALNDFSQFSSRGLNWWQQPLTNEGAVFNDSSRTVFNLYPGRPFIVINPEHGGSDPGAIRGNFSERDAALAQSRLLATVFAFHPDYRGHYNIAFTRNSNTTDPSFAARRAVASELGAPVIITVAANSFDRPDVQGFEAWYRGSNPQSQQLAAEIALKVRQTNLTTMRYDNGIVPDGRNRHGSLAMLSAPSSSTVPVLVEPYFIQDNRSRDSLFILGLTEAIADGVDNYYRLRAR